MTVSSQELEKIIRMFNDKSTVAKEARVSVEMPDKTMWDVSQILLAQNKVIGDRESHRIIIRVVEEICPPGKVIDIL
jgi:hypothetical protein